MNLVMFPMWVLSGVFFSYERFPQIFLPWIRLLPLTALNDALRATILDGAPLHAQVARLAVLTGWAVASFVAALAIFRWT
jgi:ABC-type polysaccharide/polyol phosphate export permease